MHELGNKIDEIEEKNEYVQEVLDEPPHWILNFGISAFLVLIILILVIANFIKYPDILTADITLTTLSPPIHLVAKNDGKLTHLLVKDKETIKANQTIGIIENTANYSDVLFLYQFANKLSERLNLDDSLSNLSIDDSLKTGEITPYYLQLLKSVKDINLYESIKPINKQITLLKKDLNNYNSLLAKYQRQQSISDEQLKLASNDFYRDKKLYDEQAISAREFETQKKNHLNAQTSNQQSRIASDNINIQINSIEKNILQLQIQDYQEQTKLKNELSQNLKTLINEINKWKRLYVIESPVNGRISFFNVWAINQNITKGEELFAIVPEQQQQFIGKCTLPIANTGKLAIGQKVNIKLDNYPHNENGVLNGTVRNISEVPNKNSYAIDITLTNGLTTSYNKTLVYNEQMKGKADIITKDISVIDRVFFNFKKLRD
jgi:multidrug efflux pump subunit AcrA (membrane-fusion protein)